MAKINYNNKSQTASYAANKWNAQDANEVKASVNALYDSGVGTYKSLSGILSQAGASGNPVEIQILSNTLGVSITGERNGVGDYSIVAPSNVFGGENNKCLVFFGTDAYRNASIQYFVLQNKVTFISKSLTDLTPLEGINGLSFEIRVYN